MALSIRPRIIDLATDFFLSDERRKRKLLSWVKSILPWLGEEVLDFSASWQDGIVLCALMESISPGACPRFNLLKPHHRVNNCRLGIQLAMRYLHVNELPLSPEEIAIADNDSEVKICHLVQLLKWKYQKQGSKPTVFSSVTVDQAAPCKFQARGTGIKAGIVGKRTKFNILADTVTNLDLQIEIRGPNNEYNKEKIISVNAGSNSRYRNHVMATVVSTEDDGKTKVIEDGAGHSFLRQKSIDEDLGHLVIPFDYQCVGEGRFLVTYIPRTAGLHCITVLSRNIHIPGSPFEVKVSDWVSSWNLVPKPRVIPFDMLQSARTLSTDGTKPNLMRKLSNVAQVSKQLTRMKRRILRKVITPNGEEIICDVTPTLSRQNSGDLDVSELNKRGKDTGSSRSREAQKINNILDETNIESGLSPLEAIPEQSSLSQKSQKTLRGPDAAFLATVVAARAAAGFSNDGFVKSSRNDDAHNGKETQHTLGKMKFHESQYKNNDSGNPEIVITSDCDVSNGPDFSSEDNEQLNKRRENTHGYVVLSNSMDANESSSEKKLCTKNNLKTRNENNKRDPCEDMNESPSSNKGDNSKSQSPRPRVIDIVDTLLTNLKKDKQDGIVSPAHRNYMRSFSLDENNHPRTSYFESVKSMSSSGTSPVMPISAIISSQTNVDSKYTTYQNELIPSVGFASVSTAHEEPELNSTENHSNSYFELSIRKLGSSAEEFGLSVNLTALKDNEEVCNNSNSCSVSASDETQKLHVIDRSHSPSEAVYCLDFDGSTKESVIKKYDLDQRVNEVIEEISERDSVAQEEDTSETSFEAAEHENKYYQHEVEDITNTFKLNNKSKSLSDIGKDTEATGISSAQPLNSYNVSEFRPKHKITWSQYKSLSEDWTSRRNGLTKQEWAEIKPVYINKSVSLDNSSDAEQETLSSDFDEDIDDTFNPRSSMKTHYEFNSLATQNSDKPFGNSTVKRISSDGARKSWSQLRSMSFPNQIDYANKNYLKDDQNLALNFSGISRFGQLTKKIRKWASFDVLDDEALAGKEIYTISELNQIQNGLLNGEFDEEEDEILQIITEHHSFEQSMDADSGGITGDLSSGKKYMSYLVPVDDMSPILDHKTVSVTSGKIDDVMLTSPHSDISTKSDNSDWSDNEESASKSSTNHSSSGKNYFLKGDWSPQFVDLTYPNDVKSHGVPTNDPSPNRSHDNINVTSLPIETSVIVSRSEEIKFQNGFVVSTGNDRVGMESKETQYDIYVGELYSEENLTKTITTNDEMSSKRNNKTHILSPRQSNSYNQNQREHLTNNFANAPSDEHNVYIKRRCKPVYLHHSLPGRCICQSNNMESAAKSKNAASNCHSNRELHLNHNEIHRSEVKPSFSNLANTNSNFSTFELCSSDSTANLPVDNWSSLSKSYIDCQCNQANHLRNEAKKYPACQNIDNNCHTREHFFSRADTFREHTLTPTKYRVQRENARGNFTTHQQHPEKMMSSREISDTYYNGGHSEGSTNPEKSIVNLKLAMSPSSVRVSLCPGDRILTPTKYRRNKSYSNNARTQNDHVLKKTFSTAFDTFTTELEDPNTNESLCHCISSDTNVYQHHQNIPNSPSYPSKCKQFSDQREFCENSQSPNWDERNDICSYNACSDNSRKAGSDVTENGIHNNSKIPILSLNRNVTDRQIGNKDRESCCLCCETTESREIVVPCETTSCVNGEQKMVQGDDSSRCCNDTVHFVDRKSQNAHHLDDKLSNQELKRDIKQQDDLINNQVLSVDKLQHRKSNHQQQPRIHNPHQQYYSENDDDPNQIYLHTSQHDDPNQIYLHTSQHDDPNQIYLHTSQCDDNPTQIYLHTSQCDDNPTQIYLHTSQHDDPNQIYVHTSQHDDPNQIYLHTSQCDDNPTQIYLHTSQHDDPNQIYLHTSQCDDNPIQIYLHTSQHDDPNQIYLHTSQHDDPNQIYLQKSQHDDPNQIYLQKSQHDDPNQIYLQKSQHDDPNQIYLQKSQHDDPNQIYLQKSQHDDPNQIYLQKSQHDDPNQIYLQKSQHDDPNQIYLQKSQHDDPNQIYLQTSQHDDDSNQIHLKISQHKNSDISYHNQSLGPKKPDLTEYTPQQFVESPNRKHCQPFDLSPLWNRLQSSASSNIPFEKQKTKQQYTAQHYQNSSEQSWYTPKEFSVNQNNKHAQQQQENHEHTKQKENNGPFKDHSLQLSNLHQRQLLNSQQLSNKQQSQELNNQLKLYNPLHEQLFNLTHQQNYPYRDQEFSSLLELNHPYQDQQFNNTQQLNYQHQEQILHSPQQFQNQHFDSPQQFKQHQQFDLAQHFNQPFQEKQFTSLQHFNQSRQAQHIGGNSPQHITQHRQQEQLFNPLQQISEQYQEHIQQQHLHKVDHVEEDNQAMVLRRQSTVDTLDSGIPEDSTLSYGQTSGIESTDSNIFDLEKGFDFNIFLQP